MKDVAASAVQALAACDGVVIKVGSAMVVDPGTGEVRTPFLEALASDIVRLRDNGRWVLLVSSGAVAIGRRRLGLTRRRLRLDESQAAASVGQTSLVVAWDEALTKVGLTAAQILLTFEETENRRRHLNVRGTVRQLLAGGLVPVINENDTVATEEIRFGDNDRLAARVAVMMGAGVLVLLSGVDGVYTSDPRKRSDARWIPRIERIDQRLWKAAEGPSDGLGSGGMISKFQAAEICLAGGCSMVLTDGAFTDGVGPVGRLLSGGRNTFFPAPLHPLAARKRWIVGHQSPRGVMVVDDGAWRALRQGKSLLPRGVVAVEGDFHRGDPVVLRRQGGERVGMGLSAYNTRDARAVMGRHSSQIASVLGYDGRAEMIHSDDLVTDP